MKKLALSIFLLVASFILTPIVMGKVQAASLKFDKTSVTVDPGQTFQIGVVVDAGTDEISSTDVYVLYDSSLLTAQSVAAGTFFPTVTNNITAGKVYIAGLVDDPATSKTGSGTVATITFSALKNGSGTLTFDCTTASNSSKIIKNDLNATNIIVCSQNGSATVTVGTGGSTTPTPGAGGSGTITPSTLPQTGPLDVVGTSAKLGILLFFVGGAVRLLIRTY